MYLHMASRISSRDYLAAQKVRRYATDQIARAFEQASAPRARARGAEAVFVGCASGVAAEGGR